MMRTFLLLVTVTLLLPSGEAAAQRTYKWIDSQGNVTYRDRAPPPGSEYRVEERNFNSRAKTAADPAAEAAVSAPVVLYSVPQCNACDLARAHLKKRGVPFTDKNAQDNVEVQRELKAKAGSLSVPTILVGTKVLNTYAAGWLDSELTQAGYPEGGGEQTESKPADEEAESTGYKAPTE